MLHTLQELVQSMREQEQELSMKLEQLSQLLQQELHKHLVLRSSLLVLRTHLMIAGQNFVVQNLRVGY